MNKIEQENCSLLIPTGWNIYAWAKEHPDTTIAHAIRRLEKIFDFSDAIYFGFSGGKDSTVTANLACLELNLRRMRVEAGVDRDGNKRIDPLDAKWAVKDENGYYKRRIHGAMTDAEVCFTSTNDYAKRFLHKYGPQGFDLIEFNWICLPLAWQSGVSFDSGILISWDKEKENMWVQPMPTKSDLYGFECLNVDNLTTANPVLLSSLHPDAQKYHRYHGNVIHVPGNQLFNADKISNNHSDIKMEAVANYGRGPALTNLKPGCHEKEEQDEYSYWLCNTTWLLDESDHEACCAELQRRYDLSKNVWKLTGDPEHGCVTTSLISLRAEESLDRRVILSQGEYSTGQYSRNQGVNVCSPIFDFTTADVWRLLSATDWDVNDIYEKLYEIGVGIGDQRVGSLLNYAAIRQIATVKSLEPDVYGRINARFQNVEFMSQFSRAGYYKIGKPRDTHWDGKNHIKAGISAEEISELSDKYENYLKMLRIPYRRDGNEFWTEDPKKKGKPWYPFREVLENA